MRRQISKGKCRFCDGTFSKTTMPRHLNSCKERKATTKNTTNEKTKILHLVVQDSYSSKYWIHLEIDSNSKLKTLDNFLRKIWLECCGHLSAFTIDEIKYQSLLNKELQFCSDHKDKTMNYKIATVLGTGTKFIYEYDFGTTTELTLKILSERTGEPLATPIQIMARNNPPEIACMECGKIATQVCAQCIYDDEGWLCDKCSKKHKCGEDMLLPVVNSPRVGMCAYTGNEE